jgi:hypothetical protein
MSKKPSDSAENLAGCVCHDCSLYSDCNKGKSEKLFCARKKSICDMDSRKFCICGMCPVYADNNLKGGYFCINEIVED